MYGHDVAGRLPVRKGRAGKAVEGALGADLLGDVAGLARVGALFGRPVRLRVSPANAGKTNMELVLMAGFSGYRNYLRVKKEEDRLALLKVFER
mgnify:CR=1 FL=1